MCISNQITNLLQCIVYVFIKYIFTLNVYFIYLQNKTVKLSNITKTLILQYNNSNSAASPLLVFYKDFFFFNSMLINLFSQVGHDFQNNSLRKVVAACSGTT